MLHVSQMPQIPYSESMPTTVQESSEARFRAVFGSGRSSFASNPSRNDIGVGYLGGNRVLLVDVAPAQPPEESGLSPTPAGQNFRALLLREGEADFNGRVWPSSTVIAFYLPDEDDNEPIRYVGTSSFLEYANGNKGWFDMGNPTTFIVDAKGVERDPHYLTFASIEQVCAWLRSQPDADELAVHMSGNGDKTPSRLSPASVLRK